jgi:hypothetical protein
VLERNGRVLDERTFRKEALASTVKLRGRVRVNAGEAMREAVLAVAGAAIVSEWLFSPQLASGEVVATFEDWTLPRQDLWAVFPPGGLASAKAPELVRFVERCMAAGAVAGPRAALAHSRTEGAHSRRGLIVSGAVRRLRLGRSIAAETETIMNAQRRTRDHQKALVTGATSDIGRAIARKARAGRRGGRRPRPRQSARRGGRRRDPRGRR